MHNNIRFPTRLQNWADKMLDGFPLPLVPFVKLATRDILPIPRDISHADAHLDAAIDWLKRAHDVCTDGGVSYGYSLRGGWRASYIETTGYIATTFFGLAASRRDEALFDRAVQMVDWLLRVQNRDGSFSNPKFTPGRGIVFDTGQDLFGLVRAYRETQAQKYLAAAERAADWLVRAADEDGRWTQHTHLGVPHVYNSRVAWALMQLHQLAPTDERDRVLRANLDWAVSQQRPSGFFDRCGFVPDVAPFTHTIAYAIRGLWESGELLDDERYRAAAVRAADVTADLVRHDGFLPGQISVSGEPAARYSCLTGQAQLAIAWAKMFDATGADRFRRTAVRALRYVMARQDLTTKDLNRRGAIKGSHPTWGRYSPLTYPNWSTKFFIDAMLACREWL